ncbi:hypothetical protein M3J09_007025 [Ascochyta lentis]
MAIQLPPLDPSAHSNRRTSPITGTRIPLEKLNILEAMSINHQRPKPRRAAPTPYQQSPPHPNSHATHIKSCPVFLITSRKLCTLAKSTPALICAFSVASTT